MVKYLGFTWTPFGGAVNKTPVTKFKGMRALFAGGQTFCKTQTMEELHKLLKDTQTKLAEVQVDQRYS